MKLADAGPIIILSFILITYLISAYEKMTDWKTTLEYYKKMYASTFLSKGIMPVIIFIVGLEIVVSTFAGLGIWDMMVNQEYDLATYAFIISSILFAILLFGLRMVKDYSGAARVAIYFIISVFGLYWLQSTTSI